MNVSKKAVRILALVLCLVTVLALCAPALAAATYSYVGSVSVDSDIYASNNTTSAVVAKVSKGQVVAIRGKAGSFYQVVLNPQDATASYGYILISSISKTAMASSSKQNPVTLTGSTAGSTSGTGEAGYITNCSSYVNFRATASASGTKLGTLSKNTAVTILGTEGSFYKVIANGKTGYVSAAYVAKGTAGGSSSGSGSSSSSGTAGYITNCNSYVNFRATASASGSKLGTLSKGQAVTILGTEGKFYKVEANGKTGYVSKDYVATGSASNGGGSSTTTPGTTSGSSIGYADMRVASDLNYANLSSSVKKLLASGQSKYSDAVGYIYSPGGLISAPIRYDKNLKLLSSSYNYVSSFYNVLTRNIVVTAHNNRKSSSNPMFHYLHHYQEKALGYSKCQSSTCGKSLSSVKDLNSSSYRTWEIPIFGYSKWELWAMYETPETEPKATINYNVQHLSNASSSTIQTWINYQLSRAQASGSMGKVFNSNVRTNDVFLTLYTCGDEYDSSSAQSRVYFFFRAVK